ncbi:protein maelstrom homolog [Anopheles funestus]|uniref:protein maelstrom homolog n=1 Tax=Anopheles funestus TaxID=62324 RepID=UPI0020C6C683|nr:protein maelstrom homolog [Anopheles funestus]
MSKKNAFFYFMIEYKTREEAKGRRFRNIAEVTPVAGKLWEHMNAKQRAPYQEIAAKKRKEEREQKSCSRSSKIDNIYGKNDLEEKKADIIKKSVKDQLWRAEMEEGLDKEEFYIISMAYFCRTDEGAYIPAELGVIRFSLECGVKDQLHIHINCEKLPLGVALQAKEHATNTHGLPLPPNALGVTDYNNISSNLLTFLQVKEEIPLLFTDAKEVPIVKNMLTTILGNYTKSKPLRISSVADLFFEMKQGAEMHMMSMKVFPSVKAAQDIIDEDPFSYTENISCAYHESCALTQECALSKCIRWAYTISKVCCFEMNIDLIPGKHVPIGWELDLPESLLDNEVEIIAPNNDSSDLEDSKVAKRPRLDDRYNDSESGCSGIGGQYHAIDKPDRSQREFGHDSLLERGHDLLLGRGQDPLLGRGQDPLLERGRDPLLERGQDPLLGRGQDPLLERGQDPLLGRGHGLLLGRGYRPQLGRGYDPLLGRGYRPQLGRGHDLLLGRGYDALLGRGHRPPLGRGHSSNL